jgi:photosystem II stability/assembly factor-like uncharacterized protein
MLFKSLFLTAVVFGFSVAQAQTDPDMEVTDQRVTGAENQKKFHPMPVRGSSAADRSKAYDDRLKLETASPFGGLKWRSIGPEWQTGRVVDITAPLQHPEQLYVAFATGGLYRTDDDGVTWTSLFDGQAAYGIGALAVSKDGKTIWVGSGEANNQRTSYAGTGIFKSTDAGKSWTNMGLPESQHIGHIVIDPRNENVVYACAMGHLYSQNPERGVYKTTDGGKTWALVLKVDEETGAIDLALDPKNPNILLASMYDRDRKAWDFQGSGKGSQAFRSTNAGSTWTPIEGLPKGFDAGRIGLAFAPSHPDTAYAIVDNQGLDVDWADRDEKVATGRMTPRRFLLLTEDTILQVERKALDNFFRDYPAGDLKVDDILAQIKAKKLTIEQLRDKIEAKAPTAFTGDLVHDEVYRSDDGGKSFKPVPSRFLGEFGGYYYDRVFVNPTDENDVYVTGLPLLRSVDGGKSWTYVFKSAHVDYHAVWHDPRDPKLVWVGNDGGVYVSHDGGQHIRHIDNLAVGQATTVAVDNKYPYNVYVGLQDNGTMKGPSSYVPGESDPQEWKQVFGGDGSAVAVDPRGNGDVAYVSYQFGEIYGIDFSKNNLQWSVRPSLPKGDPPARFNWVSPITVSSFDPDIVYVGAQRLYRSFDMGHHYLPISPDLTKNLPVGNVPYSTIKDISESPLRFGLIYVGCDDGSVKMTPDGGFQWIDIATPEKNKWVSRVVASKWDEGTVYCSQSGYREDDWKAYLWKSTDFGKTWTSLVGNLPAETINVVREDPTQKNILYVGTDMGTFVSLDTGKTWESLSGSIPRTPVHDLVVQARENELVIASHARSAWVLPLKWVYALTPEIRKQPLHLFPVDDGTRTSRWGYETSSKWDSSLPKSPVVSGELYTAEPGKAFVRLLDKDGKLVKEKPFDAVRGFNDFSLELRLTEPKPAVPTKRTAVPAADVLKDPFEAQRATFVAAGDYTLEVQVGAAKASQKWKLSKS